MVEFFDNYDFKCNKIELDQCTKIKDIKKFTDSHIGFLKNNSGNKLFSPYFDRLKQLYLKLKQ